ncbi:hypothetical protein QYF36_000296 [Acer negundo]|nr:hypothetical protein QYF36_000296 [Acer negundo]
MPPTGVRCRYHGLGQQGTVSALVLLHAVKRPSPSFPSSCLLIFYKRFTGKAQLPSSCSLRLPRLFLPSHVVWH